MKKVFAMDDAGEIVKEFLVESYENLDRLDRELIRLEKSPNDREILGSVFRTIHTIKGTSGFLAFDQLGAVTHVGESLLGRLRDGQLALDPEITTGLLAMVDAVRQMLASIEATGVEGERDDRKLISRLTSLQTAPDTVGKSGANGKRTAAPGQSASDSTIRLEVALLDQLMNLVGELVLARNQILQFANRSEESGLQATSQRLNLITSELQAGVMKTRMQPIGNIWSKFPRTVRDLALACGKQVRVEMEGGETELDKTLIEAIKDPLTHLVRNSVDHGIECPEVRQAAGKNPEGRLFLRAFHEGGQVNIEISDDGAGLNQDAIRSKAVQKGVISADQAGRMSDREIVNLVFLAGFSTAEVVTNVSGRGVGMDVVKTHIEKIGGTVDLQSKPGQGVMVRMKIPLTLAIIPALIVTSAGERYAIPQVNLLELVGLDREQARKGIEFIHGSPVYRLRGRLLPLIYLKNALQTAATAAAGGGLGRVNIVVLEADGRHFGLVVDKINDTEEIVVKPLSKHLKNISVYAGATIMGDGKVALILDVLGLAQRSKVLTEGRERLASDEVQSTAEGANGEHKLVLFAGPGGARMAVPLQLVARLENIPGRQVERSGTQWVTQYRGQILPLIRVSHALEERRQLSRGEDALRLPTTATLQVLVLEHEHKSCGLVVNQILDIVESALEPQSPSTRAGVLYSSVVAERVTELLDVSALLSGGEAYEPLEGRSAGS
jgi:two-component system chemotaxis sensor kinase CheA